MLIFQNLKKLNLFGFIASFNFISFQYCAIQIETLPFSNSHKYIAGIRIEEVFGGQKNRSQNINCDSKNKYIP